ncbi:CPBP family intramembrane glutamic endopeptidase [Sediminicola sp. 1XM1-17]|uniref:CPBP family intramembrane glutamic endopeptidase n=1 Tax=Sediminicola sp. 1XM1-17 TaxID=3127702 RepID=UPI00307865F4
MYIEQAYKGLHEGWRYVVGIIIIFFGWQIIGMLPLVATLIVKSVGQGNMPVDIPGMSALLGTNLFLFLMLLSFAFGLLATLLTAKLVHNQKIIDLTTSRIKVDWNRIGFAFFLWAIISIIMVGVDIAFSPEDYIFNFKLEPFLYLLVIGGILIPVQTSCEEYLMRGYLMQGIGILVKNRWLPLVITSLVFGLLHLGNPEVEKLGYGIMVYYIGTGFFLGIMTLMDEGLELALGFHAANNLTTALLVTADWTAFQTDSIYRDISQPQLGWDVFIPVLVIYPTVLYIFSKKYGWKNWKERLIGKLQVEKSIS